MSFRSKVLDALDIKKDHVRIPVYQTFLNPSETAEATQTAADENIHFSGATVVAGDYKPYAVSKCIKSQVIGPKQRTERLEVLGFVVGDDPGTAPQLPDAINRFELGSAVPQSYDPKYTGIHYLGGLYDSTNLKLQMMRKSSVKPDSMQTMYQGGAIPGEANPPNNAIIEHTHTDWPSDFGEQSIMLNENPMADCLYYHKTQIRFLLTGIDDITKSYSTGVMDQASNHRGTVRMLVLRPRTPSVRTRVDGTSNQFIINHDFMPEWDTQLFYDKGKQMGGKMDKNSWPHTVSDTNTGGTGQSMNVAAAYNLQPKDASKHSSDVVTYGLTQAENPKRQVDKITTSTTFGHMYPTPVSERIAHELTATDLLMSKINKQKFAVLHDEVFTLDSLHHGAAAQHIANVNIPYYKKVKFAGRLQQGDTDHLSYHTNDEPMNMSSRPIVLFLSYNQKISASVEGWTAISEC
jgi:hypothetical protein